MTDNNEGSSRTKLADQFNGDTLRIICDALDRLALEHDREATTYPREYSTGVTSNDLRMRGVCEDRAKETRDAARKLRAVYSRYLHLLSALPDLQADVDALRADAERYRWLRSAGLEIAWNAQVSYSPGYAEIMDAAIDAAMAAEGRDG